MQDRIQMLKAARAQTVANRAALLERRGGGGSRGAGNLSEGERVKLAAMNEHITACEDDIAHLEAECERAGYNDPEVIAMKRATSSVDGHGANDSWAARAAGAIRKANGGGDESRAIASGSVDVPVLVDPAVTPKSRPSRLIDLLVNRSAIESNAFEYFRQTVRTNLAAPTADLATKPTSTFTLVPITDRARVIAHLSEPVPIRLWRDAEEVVRWLDAEMRAGVLDALEAQVISGSGTGENLTGLLTVAGTTAVAFATDVPTTLRKSITALQNIGVDPNALVLNPADAEALDLLKEGTGGVGFLLDGYLNGTASSANVLGPTSIQRVVSPSIPAGTAILGDWSQVKIFVREEMRLDIDAGGELFTKNAAVMRAEIRVGLGHLRPTSFAIADLTA